MAAGALTDDVDTTETGYRGPQVCTIVGITYRQLDYWARTDLLHPSITDARGSGSQRLLLLHGPGAAEGHQASLDAGVSLQAARRAIDCLRSGGDDLASANLVIDDRRSVLAHSGEEIIDLLQGGQTVLNIVPLAGVVSELAAAITELGLPIPGPDAGSASGAAPGPGAPSRATPAGAPGPPPRPEAQPA